MSQGALISSSVHMSIEREAISSLNGSAAHLEFMRRYEILLAYQCTGYFTSNFLANLLPNCQLVECERKETMGNFISLFLKYVSLQEIDRSIAPLTITEDDFEYPPNNVSKLEIVKVEAPPEFIHPFQYLDV